MGGIYDETGKDGLKKEEREEQDYSLTEQLMNKAKSAVSLFL